MPGRRAIVTGASKGIGRAIATLLGQRGYAVALVARSQDLLDGLAEELSRQSNAAPALALGADLRDVGNAPRLVEAAAAGLGGLDLLVNCAGATKRGDFFALSHEFPRRLRLEIPRCRRDDPRRLAAAARKGR